MADGTTRVGENGRIRFEVKRMSAEPGTQGAGPGSISTTWSDETWGRLEVDLARTLRNERLRQHHEGRRARAASQARAQREQASQRYRKTVRRFFGARPSYWTLLVVLSTALYFVR
jgi:hypothetical protein